MTDATIGHLGAVVTISASETTAGLPVPLTSFPKDTDPFDIPEVTIAESEMGTNGDFISWEVANPVNITLSVVANTADHVLLQTMFNRNRPEKGKRPVGDKIVLVRVLPDGSTITLSSGRMMAGTVALSMTSSGKLSTPTYTFSFGKLVPTPPNILT
ncbi:conserved hypothetical protein [Vibrio chagasii]|nr:conserved hypothetical protein [Vibrio chagasii]